MLEIFNDLGSSFFISSHRRNFEKSKTGHPVCSMKGVNLGAVWRNALTQFHCDIEVYGFRDSKFDMITHW